jgi:hypothetical protein
MYTCTVHTCVGGWELNLINHWLIHDACVIMVCVFSCGCCLLALLVAFERMIELCA